MALQLVGYTSGSGTGASYTVSLNGTLTGGIASSPSAGDIVIVVTSFGNANNSTAPTVSGNSSGAYTDIHAPFRANDTWDTNYAAEYAIQGSSVDTTLTITRVSSTAYGGVTVVQVWRGVDQGTPFDVTATTATGTNGSRPNAPAITPVTSGAVILAGGGGMQTTAGSAFTLPSNMTGGVSSFSNGTTSDNGTFLAYYNAWTSGSFDPNAATGGTTSTSSSWCASTFALRPFVAATHDTDGALTGQLGSVSGSAAHLAKHTTTGALTGQLGSASGTATRYRQFASSGALTGQGSTVTGDADREPMVLPHTTEGTLVGQGSTVNGSATRFRAHATSGALSGQGSTVTGDADRQSGVVTHVTDGTLVGQGSTVNGSSTRFRAYDTSGTLTGQDSSIVGDANRFREFSTSGNLDGQVASITGDARHNIPHATSGELTGQGSSIVGDAEHISSGHDATGDLVAQGAIIVGKASKPFKEVTGSKNIRPKPSIIVVEVDGKEYRVPALQLQSFLDAIQQKVEDTTPVKKKRKKQRKQTVEVVEVKELPQIVIKSAPVSIIPQIQNRVDEVNTIIANSFSKALQQYVQNIELENVKIELAKKQAIQDEEEWLLMIL